MALVPCSPVDHRNILIRASSYDAICARLKQTTTFILTSSISSPLRPLSIRWLYISQSYNFKSKYTLNHEIGLDSSKVYKSHCILQLARPIWLGLLGWNSKVYNDLGALHVAELFLKISLAIQPLLQINKLFFKRWDPPKNSHTGSRRVIIGNRSVYNSSLKQNRTIISIVHI